MALIVEDGSYVSTANTYVDVDYVDTYFEDRDNSTWDAATDESRERAILYAGQYLNSLTWKGYKTRRYQRMSWPRQGARDEDGFLVESTVIIERIKQAQCEAALRELTSGTLQPDLTSSNFVKKKKVDILETEFFQNAPARTLFPAVKGLLKGLIYSNNNWELIRS